MDNHSCATLVSVNPGRPGARRTGLTLVEVLAALMILGGAVTTMLLSQAAGLKRIDDSQRQLTARHLAQELIASWQLEEENVEDPATGIVEGIKGWSWRRFSRECQIAVGITMTEVTLELSYRPSGSRTAPWIRSYRWLVKHEP